MANKYKKIILIALAFILVISIPISVFAINNVDFYRVDQEVDKTTSGGYVTRESSKFEKILGGVLGAITVFGFFIAVGGIIIIGIQTVVASVEEKAVYKQKMVPFIVGLVLLISSNVVVRMVWMISSGKSTGGGTTVPPEKPNPPVEYTPN